MGSTIKTRKMTLTAILIAAAVVMSMLESMLPGISGAVPGIKLGVSNIVTMYALFSLGAPYALLIAMLKSLFVLFTRGLSAGAMSFSGGILSVCVMYLLSKLSGMKSSYVILSIFGAVAHNVAQILVSIVIVNFATKTLVQTFLGYYLPILVISGIAMGIVTGLTLRVVMPYINKISKFERGGR